MASKRDKHRELRRLKETGGGYVAEGAQVGPCPYDTDGDGHCGRPNCPYCTIKPEDIDWGKAEVQPGRFTDRMETKAL